MANTLSTFAQVLRPGTKAGSRKKKRTKTRESSRRRITPTTAAALKEAAVKKLREYMPIAPKGSWEKTSELVLQAARRAPEFGAFEGESTWSISIWASYPDKNAVVIGNTNSGQLWAATYSVDAAGLVTFPTVVKAEQTFTAVKEADRTRARNLRESATTTPIKESLKLHARIREVKVSDDDKAGAQAVCVMLSEGPGNAADGHYYTAQCIEKAAASGVFESVHCFADHADEIEERVRPERSVRDMVGWWSDVHVEEADGKKLLIGTYNIETGNTFALNKMREAKRYAEKYSDTPSKQYVGFSIYAGGQSETQEIDGVEYDAVLEITEAGSTDMVTRAGAGGKMLTLKEAQSMKTTLTPEREKQFLESLVSGITKSLSKKLGKNVRETVRAVVPKETKLTEAAFDKILEEAGVEMDDEDKGKMHAALAKALSPKTKKVKVTSGDETLDEDDDMMETGVTGDASLDDILEPDDDDEDDDEDSDEDDEDDDIKDGDKSLSESDITKLPAWAQKALKERDTLKERDAMRGRVEIARAIVREKHVPKAAQKYLLTELASCKTKRQMRERADEIIEAIIRPTFGDGVVGNAPSSRVRENASAGKLITVSGIEK